MSRRTTKARSAAKPKPKPRAKKPAAKSTPKKPAKRRAPRPAPVIRNLEQTARFFETTTPTVKSWIADGCPVEAGGSNGVPYALDLRKVDEWRQAKKEEEQKTAEERAEQEAQLRLELLGDDALTDAGVGPLTPRQRADYLRAEVDKVKLAEKRGELMPAAEFLDALVEMNRLVSARLRGLPDDLADRFGLSEDQRENLRATIDDVLNDMADEIETMTPVPSRESQDAAAAA